MVDTAPDATLVLFAFSAPVRGRSAISSLGFSTPEIGATSANMSNGYMQLPRDAVVGTYRRLFEPVTNSVARDGTVPVGSDGNDETDLNGGWLRLWNGLAGVIGASALTHEGELSYYSNYGTSDIDVDALGGGYETREKAFTEDFDEVARPWPLNAIFRPFPRKILSPTPI